jgi:hypothetical protein
MKHLILSVASLVILGCGTVVGNGRKDTKSATEKPFNSASPGAQQPVAESASNNAPPATPGNTGGASNAGVALSDHFFVACASPFAIADAASFSNDEGDLLIKVVGNQRFLSGAFSGTVTPDPSSNKYAIEAFSGAPNLTCTTSESLQLDGSLKVSVTFNDAAKVEWLSKSSKLLSFKAVSADKTETIEYVRIP